MSIACERCAVALDRCASCSKTRCEEHLVLSAVQRTRGDIQPGSADGEVQVIRCTFPGDHVVDFPLEEGLSELVRTTWATEWSAGEVRCVECRDRAAARAVAMLDGTGDSPPPAIEDQLVAEEAPVIEPQGLDTADEHSQRVERVRAEHGPDQPRRRLHERLVRRAATPSGRLVLLLLAAGAALGAVAGYLLQRSGDWVASAADGLTYRDGPLLLARAYRDLAAALAGGIAGTLVVFAPLLVASMLARRRRVARLAELDRIAKTIGCGEPGCQRCWVPKPAAQLAIGRPASPVLALALTAVFVAGITGLGLPLVIKPAKAVDDFALDAVPAAIRDECAPRPPAAGDYELVCAGSALRRRRLRQVIYRHYRRPQDVDVAKAFAAYPVFSHCRKAATPARRTGRYATCARRGRRQASVWITPDGVAGAAYGRHAKRYARHQLPPVG